MAQLSPSEEHIVDSLKLEIENAAKDTVRINALDKWDSYIYYFDTELDLKLNRRIEELCVINLRKNLSKEELFFYKNSYASSLNNLGLIYKGKGDYFKAIDYQTQGLKIREEIGDKEGIASSLNNIGLIYQDQNDLIKAVDFHKQSLKICEEIGDKKGIARSLGNLSNILTSKGEYDKAIEYGTRCLKISEEVNDPSSIAGTYNNLGIIFHLKKENDKAIDYYRKGLKKFEELGNRRGVAGSLNCMGAVFIDKGEFLKTIEYCSKAQKIAQEIGAILEIQSSANYLYKSYKKTNQFEKALVMHELFVQATDSINSEQSKKEIVRQEFKYEYEKKATADSVRTIEEKKVVAAQFKQEQTQRYGLYGGVALLLIFGGFMFNRFRVTKKQKNIIQSQKETVEEKQKEILDSIYYAKRIQSALLPTEKYIDKNINRLKKE